MFNLDKFKKNQQRVRDEIKDAKHLKEKCREALKDVLQNTGYHARIILYPGEADK